jgi:hypothetical protein
MVNSKRLIPSQLCTKTHLRASVIQKIFRGLYRTPMAGGGAEAPSCTHPRAASLRAGLRGHKPEPPGLLTDRRPWF